LNVEAFEYERGLFVRGLLDVNVTSACEPNSLKKMVQNIGGRNRLYIGFRVIKEEVYRSRPEIRRLKK
jgi:hypothetical protein